MSRRIRRVATRAEMLGALEDVPRGRAMLLAGGADLTEPGRIADLRALFATLAGYCERTGTAVVDGGTDSGVMRLISDARAGIAGGFPLVGVAPAGALARRTRTGTRIRPARRHSLILLVPGFGFGDETEWLFAAADHLAAGSAAMIVINGGRLTAAEARLRIDAGHRVVAVEGTGRAADDLASEEGLRASRRLRVIPVTVDEAGLAAAIEEDGEP